MSVTFAYRSLLALSSAWVVMACSFAISTDRLSGGPDGGAPTVDATSSSASDAPVTVDAAPAPDAPNPIATCPPNAIVCDDFERETVQGTWATVETQGGTLSIALAATKGRVLKAEVPSAATVGYVRAETVVSMGNAKGVTMGQDVRLEAPNEGGVHLGELTFKLPNSQHTVFPYFIPSAGLVIAEVVCSASGDSCTFTQSSPAVAFASAQWHRISLDVDLTASPTRLTLRVDDVTAISASSALQFSAGPLELAAGATYFDGPHGAFDVMIDNLVIVAR